MAPGGRAAAALFEDFLVVAADLKSKRTELLYCFSRTADTATPDVEARTTAVRQFCFPELADAASPPPLQSESFTFTLTQDDGTRCFGFSRRLSIASGGKPICLCVLSFRAWFSLFMHMLDLIQLNYDTERFIPAFMEAAAVAPLPPPGGTLAVSPMVDGAQHYGTFRLHAPIDERPTGVTFEPLLSALGVPNLLRVLAALMLEQRVIFVGSQWSLVSSCTHAALLLLYPLQWQHIFIPVLPNNMLSYACAPMPFVLGILSRHLPMLQAEPTEKVLLVHLESGRIEGEQDVLALAQFPKVFRDSLTTSLQKLVKAARFSRLDNAAVADAVLLVMVRLLGEYRYYVRSIQSGRQPRPGELHPAFDETGFIEAAPADLRPFIESLRGSQLFEAFINDHIEMSEEERMQSAFERACMSRSHSEAQPPLSRPSGGGSVQHSFRHKVAAAATNARSAMANKPGRTSQSWKGEAGVAWRGPAEPRLGSEHGGLSNSSCTSTLDAKPPTSTMESGVQLRIDEERSPNADSARDALGRGTRHRAASSGGPSCTAVRTMSSESSPAPQDAAEGTLIDMRDVSDPPSACPLTSSEEARGTPRKPDASRAPTGTNVLIDLSGPSNDPFASPLLPSRTPASWQSSPVLVPPTPHSAPADHRSAVEESLELAFLSSTSPAMNASGITDGVAACPEPVGAVHKDLACLFSACSSGPGYAPSLKATQPSESAVLSDAGLNTLLAPASVATVSASGLEVSRSALSGGASCMAVNGQGEVPTDFFATECLAEHSAPPSMQLALADLACSDTVPRRNYSMPMAGSLLD